MTPPPTRSPDQTVFEHADLEVAAIQRALLPAKLPNLSGWTIASHYLPCDASGGDFYGFQDRNTNELMLLVADVSGHGARAAVIMAMLRAWLESHQAYKREAINIAHDINALFNRMDGLGVFVTGVFARIGIADGSFNYINCGHPYPRILRADGTLDLLTDGHCLPLGIAEDLGLEAPGHGTLNPGDTLVINTDGIPESAAPDGTRFEDARLNASLRAQGDATAIRNSTLRALAEFRQTAPRLDDECMLVIKRNPA
ncbi:MAG: SpoIIE family protein phosphatase [Phycisphaerales bacterium]